MIIIRLVLITSCLCQNLFSLPVKKFDDYAEYYEGEDTASNLADKAFGQSGQTQKPAQVSADRHFDPKLDIFQNKPTDMAFSVLNHIFNIGRKFLKPLGIDGQAKIIKQEDKSGQQHLEFQKQVNIFGLQGKDVDKVLLTNGSPTYLNSKRIDFLGSQIGAVDLNKQVFLNPSHAGYVNCDQLQLFGGVFNNCDKRSFDLSAVPKFLQSSISALNIIGNDRKLS